MTNTREDPRRAAAGSSAQLVTSRDAARRIDHALQWLLSHESSQELLVIAPTLSAVDDLLRRAAVERTGLFGWHRATLGRLAAQLSAEELWRLGRVSAGRLTTEAVVTRAVHRLAQQNRLGRYSEVSDRPGFARAVTEALFEVRMAEIDPSTIAAEAPELSEMLAQFQAELDSGGIADRALVMRLAADRDAPHPLLGIPTLLLDVPVHHVREARLIARVAARCDDLLVTCPAGDGRSLRHLQHALQVTPRELAVEPTDSLKRLQAGLFDDADLPELPPDGRVSVLSAPGEGRECVELARRLLGFAEQGVPFDRMAILLRSPEEYRPHLEDALARAGVPAWFARGVVRPDPAGRAFLALLRCKAEGLSARRFSEYLSLGEVPDVGPDGAPPPPVARADRFVPADDEMISPRVTDTLEQDRLPADEAAGIKNPEARPAHAGSLRAPRHWEKLLIDAYVIGRLDRWRSRLDGLAQELTRRREHLLREEGQRDEGQSTAIAQDIEGLHTLRSFAIPLLEELEELPSRASWGEWLDRLSALASRALRNPRRVESVLSELRPMASVEGIEFDEVRHVLARRLLEIHVPPERNRLGRVFVAPIEEARGLSFDVVAVPGLAERLFPRNISEEPILLDAARARIDATGEARLMQNSDRVAHERLLLRIATGAATRALILSYPRIDLDQSRPRVPSFYGLEALRAAEGRLPGFDELANRAETVTEARIGWPAPHDPEQAIDEAEYDLAILERLLKPGEEQDGAARYLVTANPHLGRVLRWRARRWSPDWTRADGLVLPSERALEVLRGHALSGRSYSPTALQNFSLCPYRFFLYAVHRFAKREVPDSIEEMDPLTRGSLVHDTQFKLNVRLSEEALLPVTKANLERAQALLDEVLGVAAGEVTGGGVAGEYHDRLAPAIQKVWDDGISSIRADLRELLRLTSEDESGFVPWRFELSFGLGDPGASERMLADPHSTAEPVPLDCGIQLRGSIDLVEKRDDGLLRVTDYKTGKVKVTKEQRVAGGQSLQAVLYALTVERMFPEHEVDSGRLYYCTSAGGFEERVVPLDQAARNAAVAVATAVGSSIEQAFLPAAPDEGACRYCDYQVVCGPYEEQRVRRKTKDGTRGLAALRKLK